MENRSSQVIIVAIAMSVLILVFVPLRLWIRRRVIGRFGADDWVIILATVQLSTRDSILEKC